MALERVWMEAPVVPVFAADGRELDLSAYWNEGPVVFYFLRHFGCPLCQETMRGVQAHLAGFLQRGVDVVAIGQGSGDDAGHFCGKWSIEFPCVGDPSRASYRAYEIERGSWWQVLFKSLFTHPIRSLRLLLDADVEGMRLEATDVMQLPGVAVVESGGILRALHVAKTSDDMPSPGDVFSLLDELRLDLEAGRTRRTRVAAGIPDAFEQATLRVAHPA